MTKLSKPFRIATEGATCDGRTISRQDIVDMVSTYKRETYSARVNMEHIRGFSADPPFCAYGDVISVSSQDIELDVGGKKEKRLAMYGVVEALDNLVTLNAKGQKLYPSIEINPNFASSGKAYLQGLAITDSPASLGTEILTFAASQGDKSPFASRKQAAGNLFSAVDEGLVLEFQDETPASGDPKIDGFFTAATNWFKQFTDGKKEEPAQPVQPAQQPPANDNDVRFAAFGQGIDQLTSGIKAMGEKFTADLAAVRADVATVKASIETTEANPGDRRPAAPGGTGGNYARTDC